MEISFRELTKKAVVNVQTGARLGYICDMSFNFRTGCVLGFSLPEKGVFKKEELFIPLKNVEKIGEDVVFVQIPNDCEEEPTPPCKKRKEEDCYDDDE